VSYEFPIDLSKVREFARAVKSEHPAHQGSKPVIPPTMLTSARMIWEPPAQSAFRELNFDRARILHGEEEYVFHGPLPRAGQVLTVQARIADTYEKPGKRGGTMRFGAIVTEFLDVTGTLIAEQHTTVLETAPAQERRAQAWRGEDRRARASGGAGTSSQQPLTVGSEAEPRIFPPLTRTDFVKYQGASGDFHPLHHDEVYAHRVGFPSVFSVGMLQAGMLATYVTDWLGVEQTRRFKVRFVEQMWPGDELTCSAKVAAIEDEPGGGHRVTLELKGLRQTGNPALLGEAEFVLESLSAPQLRVTAAQPSPFPS
jgi:acyl dehydratase